MSYYMVDADQRFCREGKCHDPVKPLPGIPQCVANPLERERVAETNHYRQPTTRPRDPAVSVRAVSELPSSAAPRRWWHEPRVAHVAVPAALFLLLAPHGLLDWGFYAWQGSATTTSVSRGSALAETAVRVVLFTLAWHAMRVQYARYY